MVLGAHNVEAISYIVHSAAKPPCPTARATVQAPRDLRALVGGLKRAGSSQTPVNELSGVTRQPVITSCLRG